MTGLFISLDDYIIDPIEEEGLVLSDVTEIVVFDRNAKIVFRSVVPRLLTQSQVERELDDWRVDRANHRVQIIYSE